MNRGAATRLVLVAACGVMLAIRAAAAEPDKPAAGQQAAAARWPSSLEEGYRRALRDRKPLLICVGAKWSAPSRKMAKEMDEAAVAAELARWTPILLDLDAQAGDVEELGVVTAPALRIFTPTGQYVAGCDRYLSPDECVAWLKEHYDAALAPADDVLMATGEPSITAVIKLVKQFSQRNAALREAAIRRLTPYPEAAKAAVVKAIRESGLSARLAAMEVLEAWRAPLTGLDPWRPETFTPERLARLEKWKDQTLRPVDSAPANLTPEQLASAREQIEWMLRADETESDAAGHRLARLGPALLPEVYARLKDAAADRDRRRLLVLRYRLVADGALDLSWPGGIQRLADRNPRQRQKAAEELAQRAAGTDQPLLLELFADPDPLVREISLRGLQHIGGKQANAALVRLLGDPDPNVRAAVLKQLEASPSAAMTADIVKYLNHEKDPDLIGHGIRVLQAAKGTEAVKCLMRLLKHESWQVRAEAAAAIGKAIEGGRSSFVAGEAGKPDESAQLTADVYVALIDLLDDPEPFVVAKGIEGLSGADMAVAVDPLAKAAARHPDLAPTILPMLARGNAMRPKAMPHLRKFTKHQDPRIRAAAIAAICSLSFDDAEEEVLAGLGDKESQVRLAAATAAVEAMDSLRESAMQKNRETANRLTNIVYQSPAETQVDLLSIVAKFLAGSANPMPGVARQPDKDVKKEPATAAKPAAAGAAAPKQAEEKAAKKEKPAEAKPGAEDSWWDDWLRQCYAGRNRPKWTARLVPPLEKMLRAEAPKERVLAALLLAPLGKAGQSLPVLEDAVRTNPELFDTAVKVLPWLMWAERVRAFRAFRGLAKSDEALSELTTGISAMPDPRAADLFWQLLAEPTVKAAAAPQLFWALTEAYFGTRYVSSDVPPAVRRRVIEAAKPRALAGGDWQRRAALALLATAAKDEAAETAAKLADDAALSRDVRIEAFQVLLIAQSESEGRRSAVAALRSNHADRKAVALKYLAHGPGALHSLPSGLMLMIPTVYMGSSDGSPIVPQPPPGLKLADVRPLLHDADRETAACAGYLAVLLGDGDGMTPLLRYWHGEQQASDHWVKSVYRAIAVTDDPKYIPLLRDIYAKLERYEVREFYWTIRIMSGEEILKFRKQVRDAMKESE